MCDTAGAGPASALRHGTSPGLSDDRVRQVEQRNNSDREKNENNYERAGLRLRSSASRAAPSRERSPAHAAGWGLQNVSLGEKHGKGENKHNKTKRGRGTNKPPGSGKNQPLTAGKVPPRSPGRARPRLNGPRGGSANGRRGGRDVRSGGSGAELSPPRGRSRAAGPAPRTKMRVSTAPGAPSRGDRGHGAPGGTRREPPYAWKARAGLARSCSCGGAAASAGRAAASGSRRRRGPGRAAGAAGAVPLHCPPQGRGGAARIPRGEHPAGRAGERYRLRPRGALKTV